MHAWGDPSHHAQVRVFEVCMNACMDRLEEEVKCPSGFGG
jgi:hypothetical protein